jgi:hypothetical protein
VINKQLPPVMQGMALARIPFEKHQLQNRNVDMMGKKWNVNSIVEVDSYYVIKCNYC